MQKAKTKCLFLWKWKKSDTIQNTKMKILKSQNAYKRRDMSFSSTYPFLMMFCYFHRSCYLSFDLFSLFFFMFYKKERILRFRWSVPLFLRFFESAIRLLKHLKLNRCILSSHWTLLLELDLFIFLCFFCFVVFIIFLYPHFVKYFFQKNYFIL